MQNVGTPACRGTKNHPSFTLRVPMLPLNEADKEQKRWKPPTNKFHGLTWSEYAPCLMLPRFHTDLTFILHSQRMSKDPQSRSRRDYCACGRY